MVKIPLLGKQTVSAILTALATGMMSFTCCEFYDDNEYDRIMKSPCTVHVRNLSEHRIFICVAGKPVTDHAETSYTLFRPVISEVKPGAFGKSIDVYAIEKVDVGLHTTEQTTWGDYFSDDIERLYIAVSPFRSKLEKWVSTHNDTILSELSEWTPSMIDLEGDNIEYIYYGPETNNKKGE